MNKKDTMDGRSLSEQAETLGVFCKLFAFFHVLFILSIVFSLKLIFLFLFLA